ncbi:hypothetical protein D3C77_364670 [compost metagenome]
MNRDSLPQDNLYVRRAWAARRHRPLHEDERQLATLIEVVLHLVVRLLDVLNKPRLVRVEKAEHIGQQGGFTTHVFQIDDRVDYLARHRIGQIKVM